ncbi:hypothetical protein L914_00879 [Phytophthora nicotianae]|uniref:Uncharacterized protein n=1 Tax=Phytophthora nicotianae TaxID=4792 RepID=W2P7U4_PHYNI|nr:hypothetical protein L914_00879 [Phytophthora nicotianae]
MKSDARLCWKSGLLVKPQALADKYGVHHETLLRWDHAEDRIKDAQGLSRKKKKIRKVKRGVTLRFPGLESRPLEWFTDMRKNKSMCE